MTAEVSGQKPDNSVVIEPQAGEPNSMKFVWRNYGTSRTVIFTIGLGLAASAVFAGYLLVEAAKTVRRKIAYS